MLQKIKTLVLVIAASVSFSAPVLVPSLAFATCQNDIQSNIDKGAAGATGGGLTNCDPTQGQGNLSNLAKTVVNILSLIVGVVAVIMIIIGGFRYITSGGESGNVSGAKNTLIYAIVGLLIVALAQLIVHFVLGQAGNVTQ